MFQDAAVPSAKGWFSHRGGISAVIIILFVTDCWETFTSITCNLSSSEIYTKELNLLLNFMCTSGVLQDLENQGVYQEYNNFPHGKRMPQKCDTLFPTQKCHFIRRPLKWLTTMISCPSCHICFRCLQDDLYKWYFKHFIKCYAN